EDGIRDFHVTGVQTCALPIFESTDLILENKIPELLIQFNTTLAKGFDGQHYIAGLASHFRDLLVSKTPETIELLEVGEQTKEKRSEERRVGKECRDGG